MLFPMFFSLLIPLALRFTFNFFASVDTFVFSHPVRIYVCKLTHECVFVAHLTQMRRFLKNDTQIEFCENLGKHLVKDGLSERNTKEMVSRQGALKMIRFGM